MATTTPNYLWSVPTSSDLVKNGATAIETLGDSVDASLWNVGYGQAGKNRVINGDFNIWQRGTSFTFAGTGGYTSDRFLADSGSGGTVAVTRQTFTAGQTDVPNAVYFYQAAYSVSGTTPVVISTRLEDVNTLAGQAATFSFYAKINTGTQSITPRYVQDFGSGGSATVVTNMTAQTLTTSWQRFTITSTIPSVSGKTIGTSSYLRLDLLAATSGTLTYQIANMQLEYGSKATPFQTASGGSQQAELAMCQRYFQKSYPQATAPATNSTATGLVFGAATATLANSAYVVSVRTPIVMRTAPTVTIYSFTTSQSTRVSDASGTDLAASSGATNLVADSGFTVQNSSGGLITASNGGFVFHYAANAEL